MKFSVFQVSRKGGREKNEDRMGYCYTRESGLFVLADGMGGYNAGEGAVWRWLRQYGDLQEIDLFVEAIPYDETRGYTKRVLSSFLTYRWLQPPTQEAKTGSLSARVPEISFALPPPPGKARTLAPAPAVSAVSASEKGAPASAVPAASGDAKPAETPHEKTP